MSKLLEKAVVEVLPLPESRQDEIAAVILEIAGNDRMVREWGLTPEQVPEVRKAIEEDDWAAPEEVEAFFAQFR
jgi:hypothetical protein